MAHDDDDNPERENKIYDLFEALYNNEREYAEKLVNVIIDMEEDEKKKRLKNYIIKEKKEESPFEKTRNEKKDTPLHVAASKGFAKLCKLMVDNYDRRENLGLMKTKNQKGETPLFLAALSWNLNKYTFLYFIDKLEGEVDLQDLINNDGDSILHSAINLHYFDLAIIILDYYDKYNFSCAMHANKKAIKPLKALANIPSAFRSGTDVFGWNLILYQWILVAPLDPWSTKRSMLQEAHERDWNPRNGVIQKTSTIFPKNYETLENLLSLFFTWVLRYFVGILLLFPESKTKNCFWLIRILFPEFKFLDEYLPDREYDREIPRDRKYDSDEYNRYSVWQDENNLSGWLPPNYNTFLQFINATVGGVVLGLFGLGKFGYDGVKRTKCNHIRSRQVLKGLMKLYGYEHRRRSDTDEVEMFRPNPEILQQVWQHAGETSGETSEADKKEDDKSETAFVIAVRNGIVEMVDEILEAIPDAIYEKSSEGENVLVVAVKNRKADVIEAMKRKVLKNEKIMNEFISGAVDGKDNILHLAAKGLTGDQRGEMAGAALQMMWDTKWFEYIKDLVPHQYTFLRSSHKDKEKKDEAEHCCCELLRNIEKERHSSKGEGEGRAVANEEVKGKTAEGEGEGRAVAKGKTAEQIFKEEHKDMIKEGSEWLKNTSESCSVVAALIASVSFTTACTIPGGNNNGGYSPFNSDSKFKSFAISSLIGLCYSVTSLTMFLSILTSRKEARDFRRSLPLKLLVGLSSLFLSIVAMIISFCSGHYFLINGNSKGIPTPLYAAIASPAIILFAVAQLPLYYDLLIIFLFSFPYKSKGFGAGT